MKKFTAPFQSRRVQDVSPEVRDPTPFEVIGGWGTAVNPNALPEDLPSEREQRSAGATALAALYRQRVEDQRAAMEWQLGTAPRGYDYSRGLRYREDS
jgi:hypothetical protein